MYATWLKTYAMVSSVDFIIISYGFEHVQYITLFLFPTSYVAYFGFLFS